jgi:hypothetical protein
MDTVFTEQKNTSVRLPKGAFYGLIWDEVMPSPASHILEPVVCRTRPNCAPLPLLPKHLMFVRPIPLLSGVRPQSIMR